MTATVKSLMQPARGKVSFHFSENLPPGPATLHLSYTGQLGQDFADQNMFSVRQRPDVGELVLSTGFEAQFKGLCSDLRSGFKPNDVV